MPTPSLCASSRRLPYDPSAIVGQKVHGLPLACRINPLGEDEITLDAGTVNARQVDSLRRWFADHQKKRTTPWLFFLLETGNGVREERSPTRYGKTGILVRVKNIYFDKEEDLYTVTYEAVDRCHWTYRNQTGRGLPIVQIASSFEIDLRYPKPDSEPYQMLRREILAIVREMRPLKEEFRPFFNSLQSAANPREFLRRSLKYLELLSIDLYLDQELIGHLRVLEYLKCLKVCLEKTKAYHTNIRFTGGSGAIERDLRLKGVPAPVIESLGPEIEVLAGDPDPGDTSWRLAREKVTVTGKIPWGKTIPIRLEPDRMRRDLTRRFYGLEEPIAVTVDWVEAARKANGFVGKGLCFVGPPGSAKTSLVQAIAENLGIPWFEVPLGGLMTAERFVGSAPIWTGARPGRVVEELIRCGILNPLGIIEELDKAGSGKISDPRHSGGTIHDALLTYLDRLRNRSIQDPYLGIDYDASRILWVATANQWNPTVIPEALQRRFRPVMIQPYTVRQKIEIAERIILPRLLSEVGLEPEAMIVPRETFLTLIYRYTREGGVGNLENFLERLRDHAVAQGASNSRPVRIGRSDLLKIVGYPNEKALEPKSVSPTPVGMVMGVGVGDYIGEVGPSIIHVTKRPRRLPAIPWRIDTGRQREEPLETTLYARMLIYQNYAQIREHFRGKPQDLETVEKEAEDFLHASIHHHMSPAWEIVTGPSAGVVTVLGMLSAWFDKPVRPKLVCTGEVEPGKPVSAVRVIGGVRLKLQAMWAAKAEIGIFPEENREELHLALDELVRDSHLDKEARVEILPIDPVQPNIIRMVEQGTKNKIVFTVILIKTIDEVIPWAFPATVDPPSS